MTTAVNWTEIGNLISDSATVFTAIVDVVVALVPLLIVLAVVGFILGLFDAVLRGLTNRFRGV